MGLRSEKSPQSIAVSIDGCPVEALKAQDPIDCLRGKKSSDLSRDTNISEALGALEAGISSK